MGTFASLSQARDKVHVPRKTLSAVQVPSVKAVREGRGPGEPRAFLALDRR